MPFPNRGGIARPTMTSSGSLTNPIAGDIWSIVTPSGVEASDYSMMQDRGSGPVVLAMNGPQPYQHVVASADIAPAGVFWPVTVRDLSINLVSLPINTGPGPVSPSVITNPSINGTPAVGSVASGTAGTYSGSPTPTVVRRWLVDGTVMATAATYTPVSADQGKVLTIQETATNTGGSAVGTSAGVVIAALTNTAYGIASNRFAMPPDVGTGDSLTGATFTATATGTTAVTLNNIVGQLAEGVSVIITGTTGGAQRLTGLSAVVGGSATATLTTAQTLTNAAGRVTAADWLGGNFVESTGRYHRRRWLFQCAQDTIDGIFVFPNVCLTPGGVVDMQTGFTIQRVDLRSVQRAGAPGPDGLNAISGSTAVASIKFGGAAAKAMTAGIGAVAADPVSGVTPAGEYFCDVFWTLPLGSCWPSTANNYLPGEASQSSISTDLALSAMNTSGQSFALGGANYGPIGFYGKGNKGVIIIGDSTEDLTSMIGSLLSRDIGHVAIAMGDSATTRLNYLETARYSSGIAMLTANQPVPGSTSYKMIDWLDSFYKSFWPTQTVGPFHAVASEMGKNSTLQGATLSGMQALMGTMVSTVRAKWPNIPFYQEELTPSTFANVNNSGQVNDTDVTPQVAQMGNTANGGFIEPLNTWIRGGGAGTFNGGVATASAVRSATSAATYQSWKTDGAVGNLKVAIAANTVKVMTLDVAFPVGTGVTFEPFTTNVDPAFSATLVGYQVLSTTPNAGNAAWTDHQLISTGRSPTQRNVVLAHAVDTVVRGNTAADGNHQNHKGSLQMSAVWTTGPSSPKSALIASMNAYNGV